MLELSLAWKKNLALCAPIFSCQLTFLYAEQEKKSLTTQLTFSFVFYTLQRSRAARFLDFEPLDFLSSAPLNFLSAAPLLSTRFRNPVPAPYKLRLSSELFLSELPTSSLL